MGLKNGSILSDTNYELVSYSIILAESLKAGLLYSIRLP